VRTFTQRLDTMMRRAEMQRVFEEAHRFAKDPISRARIDAVHRELLRRAQGRGRGV
jgi:hypothetical protein